MQSQDNLVVCPACGTKNRIGAHGRGRRPVCGKCKALLPVGEYTCVPVEVTDATFEREVLSHPGAVLMDCWAPWCGPCKMVAPILDELAASHAGRVKIAKLNVDENPRTASRFGIQSIPTMLVFRQGKEVDRLVGALPKQQIEARLARFA